MIHAQAHLLANKLIGYFSPFCEKIAIAGSIRRGCENVHDIELVAIPRPDPDLFGHPARIYRIHSLIDDGIKSGDWARVKGGDKYICLQLAEGINLDLFLVTPPAQWGVIYLLRTGPANFSHWMVTPKRQGGVLPSNARVSGGYISVNNKPLSTPDEESYFRLCGMDYIPPQDRTTPTWGRSAVHDTGFPGIVIPNNRP